MNPLFNRFVGSKSGATAIEYALIAALVSIAAIGAMTTVGTNVNALFTRTSTALAN